MHWIKCWNKIVENHQKMTPDYSKIIQIVKEPENIM